MNRNDRSVAKWKINSVAIKQIYQPSAAFFGGVSLRSSKQDTRRKINSAATKQSE